MPAEVMPWASIWYIAPFMPHDQYCDASGTDQTAIPRIT